MAISTGTYVGYLSQQFDSDSARIARIRSDIALTQQESQAAILSMRETVARQVQAPTKTRGDIDTAAAGLGDRIRELQTAVLQYAPQSAELRQGLAQLQRDRREMLDLAAKAGGPLTST